MSHPVPQLDCVSGYCCHSPLTIFLADGEPQVTEGSRRRVSFLSKILCLLPLSEKCLSFTRWNSPCLGTLALGHVILNIQKYLIFKMLHYSSTSAVNISTNLLSFHFWRVPCLPLYWYSLTGTSSWKQTVLIPFFLCNPKRLFLVLHSYHTPNDT